MSATRGLATRCNNNNATIALTIARTAMTAIIKPRHGTIESRAVEDQEQGAMIRFDIRANFSSSSIRLDEHLFSRT